MAQHVFITGGTGYVGRHVIPALIARGHRVRALVRPGSEAKAPRGCELVVGNPFDRATFAHAIAPCDTFLQLVGVPHPSPSKAQQFLDIDLRSALESIAAASQSSIVHFVYVSVAQPAPVMQAYQHARQQAERALEASGLRRTILRPWYVLGPGHRWPYLVIQCAGSRAAASTRVARRLGLVGVAMVHALVDASAPRKARIVGFRKRSDRFRARSRLSRRHEEPQDHEEILKAIRVLRAPCLREV